MTNTILLQKHDAERSPKWPAFRDVFIAQNPACMVCGRTTKDGVGLQAHHIFPFHYCIALGRPDLELNARNLITLCETERNAAAQNHHLLVGHLNDFESSNLDVLHDAQVTYKGWLAATIRADAGWQRKKASRLPHIALMNENDKAAFIWAMNSTFPEVGSPAGQQPANLPSWIPLALGK